MPGPIHLKKSLFLAAKRCPRKAWLLRNRTSEAVLSLAGQFRTDHGIETGVNAGEIFPE